MTEDVAKTVYLAMQMGELSVLTAEEVAKWRHRYLFGYGQTHELG